MLRVLNHAIRARGAATSGYVFGQPWLLTDSTSGIQVVNINAVVITSSSSASWLGEPGTWKASFPACLLGMPSVLTGASAWDFPNAGALEAATRGRDLLKLAHCH